MPNYDEQDGTDGANAMDNAIRALKGYEFNYQNLDFYFNQIEIKMQAAGVKKNFTKLQVLSTILPQNVINEVMPLLMMKETDFPEKDGYLQLKNEIMSIFGQPANAGFERAMSRVLAGKPSTLGRALINDMCKKTPALTDCCCKNWVYGQWMRNLPGYVKRGIASYGFDEDNYKDIFQRADDIYSSDRPVPVPTTPQSVAALAVHSPVAQAQINAVDPLDDGFHPAYGMNQDANVIAALQYGRGGRGQGRGGRGFGQGRGYRGNRGGGRGSGGFARGGGNQNNGGQTGQGQGQGRGGAHPRHKTQRHADSPPFQSCWRHWTYGKGAHFCEEPSTCPWKDVWIPKSNTQ